MLKHYKLLLSEFFPEVHTIRLKQRIRFNELVKGNDKKDNVVLLYFITQTDSAWEDIEFSLRLLGYNELKHFAIPIRGVFNKVIKLLYLTHQTEEKRDILCRKDFLKMASLFYSLDDEGKNVYKKSFDDFNTLGLNIDSKITAFPDMQSMLKKVFPNEFKKLSLLYADLSELVHGNVLFNFRKDNYLSAGLGVLGRFAFELIKVNDWHINNGVPSTEIIKFLNKWKERLD